jgi:hypothetical protein
VIIPHVGARLNRGTAEKNARSREAPEAGVRRPRSFSFVALPRFAVTSKKAERKKRRKRGKKPNFEKNGRGDDKPASARDALPGKNGKRIPYLLTAVPETSKTGAPGTSGSFPGSVTRPMLVMPATLNMPMTEATLP